MTDAELKDAAAIMRQRAARVGPQHAFWEIIMDVEALLAGLPTEMSREVIVKEVENALNTQRSKP